MPEYKAVTTATYDQIAHNYVERSKKLDKEDLAALEYLDEFMSYLPSGGRVLDIGFGGARDSRYLQSRGFDVLGIDNAPEMVRTAHLNDPEGEYVCMDFEEMKFDEEFDGAWANASVHHVPKANIPEVLGKIFTALKSGGYLYIKVRGGRGEGMQDEEKFGRSVRRYYALYKPDELSQIAESVGFKTIKSSVERPSWTHLLVKKL